MTGSSHRHASLYDGLDRGAKALALASILHELTIIARGAYSDTPQHVHSHCGLGTINEMQHLITGHLRDLLQGIVTAASGQEILYGLYSIADRSGIRSAVTDSVDRAIKRN